MVVVWTQSAKSALALLVTLVFMIWFMFLKTQSIIDVQTLSIPLNLSICQAEVSEPVHHAKS